MSGIPIKADQLAQARRAKRLTQEEFAEAAGITRVWLSLMERGLRDPGMATLDKLTGVLGVDTVAALIVDDTDRATYLGHPIAGDEE